MQSNKAQIISGGAKQWRVLWKDVPEFFRELCLELAIEQKCFEEPCLGKHLVILQSKKDQVRTIFFFY